MFAKRHKKEEKKEEKAAPARKGVSGKHFLSALSKRTGYSSAKEMSHRDKEAEEKKMAKSKKAPAKDGLRFMGRKLSIPKAMSGSGFKK